MAIQTAPTQATTYKFSVAQFEQMISEGIFEEDERVELVDGEVLAMTPINHPHAATVSSLEFIFHEALGRAAYVWAQQPLTLNTRSRLQPDILVLRWQDARYMSAAPTIQDVLLLIEVSDTSLADDRGWKRTAYARAGIPQYWIVNVKAGKVETYYDPDPQTGTYKTNRIFERGDAIPLRGGLEVEVSVDEILGGK